MKELRNSFTGKMACLLTSSKMFNVVGHHHLMVGHTHEDVGFLASGVERFCVQTFSMSVCLINTCCLDGAMALVTSALAGEFNLQTPRDVIRTGPWFL